MYYIILHYVSDMNLISIISARKNKYDIDANQELLAIGKFTQLFWQLLIDLFIDYFLHVFNKMHLDASVVFRYIATTWDVWLLRV